jgi:hypothetical protein
MGVSAVKSRVHAYAWSNTPCIEPGRYCSPRHSKVSRDSKRRGCKVRVEDVAGTVWRARQILLATS